MEREPIEPAVLAVELYREDLVHRKRSWTVAAVALVCSLLGALAVLAAIRLSPGTFIPPAPTTVAATPKDKPGASGQRLYSEGVDVPKVVTPKSTDAANTPKTPAPAKPLEQGSSAPLNPFSGAIISRSPIPGEWKPGDPPPSETGSVETKKPGGSQAETSSPTKSSPAILVTARSGGGDPEGEAEQIASALRGAGASVRTATHYSLAGGVIGVQVIATVPVSSVDAAISRLSSTGARGADRWSGSVEERASRVSGILSSRIRELRTKETELKDKYEEDATEVTVIREEIQSLNQGLGMVRAAKSGGVAVILIGVGSL